jgi:hypothetical protein
MVTAHRLLLCVVLVGALAGVRAGADPAPTAGELL